MPTTMRGFRSGEVWDDALTIATARGESLSSVLNDALRRYVRRHGALVAGQTAAPLEAPATRDASGDAYAQWGLDPAHNACDACNAEPGEPCRVGCIGEAATRDASGDA